MSKIGPCDIVYEIGPGNGILTAELARIARQVIAIEKDPDLVHRLRERFRPLGNVEIVEQDFVDYTFRTPGKVFANIPYNVTSQIVRKILYGPTNIGETHLILQKEAAKKFSGSPKESFCSLLAKPFFEFRILYQLRRTDFRPVPAVDSVLLSIKRRTHPLLETHEVASYRDFVQYGFGRWKPNLKLAFKSVFTYKQWKRLAHDLHFPVKATPTELSLEQWLNLYRGFVKWTRQDRRPRIYFEFPIGHVHNPRT
jgi:23S rRNA (adenine-N6)-dimethyltransferase